MARVAFSSSVIGDVSVTLTLEPVIKVSLEPAPAPEDTSVVFVRDYFDINKAVEE